MFLGIDIGTGSTKGVVVDAHGVIHATRVIEHNISTPKTGWAECDARVQWWGEVQHICQELMGELAGKRLHGVCVSGMGPCLVVTDENMMPVRPAILYGIDTRAQQQIEHITAQLGQENIVATCGNALSSQSVGPKMRWIHDNEPEVFAKARYWFSAHSYISALLTGEYTIDHHTASQSDPLYNLKAQQWQHQWYADIAGHLDPPRLVWPTEVVGHVSTQASQDTGIPAGTPVCAGTVDAWAEAWSAGVQDPGDAMLQYGSTLFVVHNVKDPSVHPDVWSTTGVKPGSRSLAAGTATSGSVTTWWRRMWGNPEFDALINQAAQVPPGSRGLMVLPYFAGERSPIFDPDARGMVMGLTLSHGRAELFRATYEGIACGVRQMLQVLEDSAEPPQRLVAVGGGAASELWVQIVSDVTGRVQYVPEQTIGAAYGDAMIAAHAIAGLDTSGWVNINRIVKPQEHNREIYDNVFRDFVDLYELNKNIMHRLSQRQRLAD